MAFTLEKSALKHICAELELPEGDSFTQDWIYELSEEYRTEGYLQRYISAYKCSIYTQNERELLVRLILDVVNDLLTLDQEVGRRAWLMTVDALGDCLLAHSEVVEYWSVVEEPLEDAFALTPLIRNWTKSLIAPST